MAGDIQVTCWCGYVFTVPPEWGEKRLLANVYIGDKDNGAEMLRSGFARPRLRRQLDPD